MFFFPLCGTTASDLCTFVHAGLNCASCSNNITPTSAQVPHWSHAPLDGVIQPAVHFIVYTPWNGDICEKANKNIPPARNSPGISSPTPGYDSFSAPFCFHRTLLFQRADSDPVLVNGVVFFLNGRLKTWVPHRVTAWSHFSANCRRIFGQISGNLLSFAVMK